MINLKNSTKMLHRTIRIGFLQHSKTLNELKVKLLENQEYCLAKTPLRKKSTRYEDGIPRQPVPPLHLSMERYLKAVRPLVTPEQFNKTKEVVQEFSSPGGLGEKLHAVLEERYRTRENYIADWWLDLDFLEHKEPLPVFQSPSAMIPLPQLYVKDVNSQLECASTLIVGLLDYIKKIYNGELAPDVLGGQKLDMSQYPMVFQSCREPGIPKDKLTVYKSPSRHIIIARRNHFFKLVLPTDAVPSEILQKLRVVIAITNDPAPAVGIMTCQNRDDWCKARDRLMKVEHNKMCIEEIQRSLFLVCLDQTVISEQEPVKAGILNSLHGMGNRHNSGNRWADKTLQFSIPEEGYVGMTVEHTPAEGFPSTRGLQYAAKRMVSMDAKNPPPSQRTLQLEKLEFKVSQESLNDIKKAVDEVDKLVSVVEVDSFSYDIGTHLLKSKNLSPDSFAQMVLQLAYYRLHKRPGCIYEVVSGRRFRAGRMEIVRSSTQEALDLCRLMEDDRASDGQKFQVLKAAVDSHKTLVREAYDGQGLECLLEGYKKAAQKLGMPIPALFTDIGYQVVSEFTIVSSQIPLELDIRAVYGPRVKDGYGCFYGLHKDYSSFSICCLRGNSRVHALATHTESVLRDFHGLLLNRPNFV